MEVVDLNSGSFTFNKAYLGVSQPMITFHSVEELKTHITKCPDRTFKIFKNFADISEMYRRLSTSAFNEFLDSNESYIATEETIVPGSFNREGDTLYKLTTDMKVIITDNCFVRVFKVIPLPGNVVHMVTSAGMQAFFVNGEGGDLSAAIRPSFSTPRQWDRKASKVKREKQRNNIVKRYSESKTIQPLDWKFLYELLNPLSDNWLNLDRAAKATFASSSKGGASFVPQKRLREILSSERMQNLIFNEMRKVMPRLLEQIKATSNPEKVAEWLAKIADDAVNNPEATIKDKLLAVSGVLQTGYIDEGVFLTTDIEKQLPPVVTPGLPAGQQLVGQQLPVVAGALGEPYKDEDLNTNPEKSSEAKDEIDLEQLKKDTNTLEDYVEHDSNIAPHKKGSL